MSAPSKRGRADMDPSFDCHVLFARSLPTKHSSSTKDISTLTEEVERKHKKKLLATVPPEYSRVDPAVGSCPKDQAVDAVVLQVCACVKIV
jgi:hypothetical protein